MLTPIVYVASMRREKYVDIFCEGSRTTVLHRDHVLNFILLQLLQLSVCGLEKTTVFICKTYIQDHYFKKT